MRERRIAKNRLHQNFFFALIRESASRFTSTHSIIVNMLNLAQLIWLLHSVLYLGEVEKGLRGYQLLQSEIK